MKAWQVYDINDMRLEDIPIPEVRPGWLLARVKTFQPSITEVQRFLGISQRGLSEMKAMIHKAGSICMGHEVCAVVEAVGDNCDIKEGDRIAYFHHEGRVAGSDYPGCFAEYYLLPISAASKMDPAIPDIEGPALQPFSSCVRVVREANLQLGETVVVFGQGVMGLNVTQLCRLAGAGRIISVDLRDQCLRVSRELGAEFTINARQEDSIQAILDLTGGKGADVAFECASGSPEVGLSGGKTFFDAISSLHKSGRLVQVAFFHENLNLDPNLLRSKRVKYIFPDEAPKTDMDIGIQLVAQGKIRFKPYMTHVLQGIEKLPEAIDITAHKARYNAINPPVVVVST